MMRKDDIVKRYVWIITDWSDYLKLTEVCHFGHIWLSYGRCTMSGSPMERSEAAP